jgi:hypothetical protein
MPLYGALFWFGFRSVCCSGAKVVLESCNSSELRVIILLIKDRVPAQNYPMTGPAMGTMPLARQQANRNGGSVAAMAALAWLLGACSADLSLNNLTLSPKPEGSPKSSDWSTQAWGRSSSGTVTTADIVGPEGQCPARPGTAPAQSGTMTGQTQGGPVITGGISLQMTECEVVLRAGPIEKMEVGTNARGERSLVLTYVAGPSPGVYRFTGGRLVSIERAPPVPAAPEAPAKSTSRAKKPAGS